MKFFKRAKFLLAAFLTLIFLFDSVKAGSNFVRYIKIPENIPLFIEKQIKHYHLKREPETNNFVSDDYLLIDVDVSKLKSTDELYLEMGKRFKFNCKFWLSDKSMRTLAYWLDCMHSIHCDIPQKKILLIVRNLSKFYPLPEQKDYPGHEYYANSDIILDSFSNYILPYYENREILRDYCKEFNVYYS